MSHLNPTELRSLEASTATAAAYLDACDGGARFVRLEPEYYRACGNLLHTVFSATDPRRDFPGLLAQSAAAREIAENIEMGRRINVSRLGYYPQLAAILNRISS